MEPVERFGGGAARRGLWMIAGLVALLCLLWSARRALRGINEHAWRLLEESGSALAPLIVFALLWLMVDLARRPNARASLQD